jgi:hypothetical protein
MKPKKIDERFHGYLNAIEQLNNLSKLMNQRLEVLLHIYKVDVDLGKESHLLHGLLDYLEQAMTDFGSIIPEGTEEHVLTDEDIVEAE